VTIESFPPETAVHWAAVNTALACSATYSHPAPAIRRIETHISVIYLAGPYAYKIKKPVDFGVLDFRLLATRHAMCKAEVELNRRLAQRLYLGVVAIYFDGCRYSLGGSGEIVDYAVQMLRFDDSKLFSVLLKDGHLELGHIERAAQRLAAFHCQAPVAAADSHFGAAELLHGQMNTVLQTMPDAYAACTSALIAWFELRHLRLRSHFEARRRGGFIRECHGDLHLENIVADPEILMFDCIEFSEDLRWIDVINDLAFLVMYLLAHQRRAFAFRALNRWLEGTGDYAGLAALPLYVAYRALVRAWVVKQRNGQTIVPPWSDAAAHYWQTALTASVTAKPALLLCHGFSGSGKSVASEALAMHIGAVRVCADLERKRTGRMWPALPERLPRQAYAPESIDASYRHLSLLARDSLHAGFTTVVDASFLHRHHRRLFIELARTMGVPIRILDFVAPRAVLASRVQTRASVTPGSATPFSDADVDVLQGQLRDADALCGEEVALTLRFDSTVMREQWADPNYWLPLQHELARAGMHGALT